MTNIEQTLAEIKNLNNKLAIAHRNVVDEMNHQQRKSPLNERIRTLEYQLNYAKREIEALHEKFGKPVCSYCGGGILECDGIQTMGPDPYAQEIHGDNTEMLMCEGQRSISADDI